MGDSILSLSFGLHIRDLRSRGFNFYGTSVIGRLLYHPVLLSLSRSHDDGPSPSSKEPRSERTDMGEWKSLLRLAWKTSVKISNGAAIAGGLGRAVCGRQRINSGLQNKQKNNRQVFKRSDGGEMSAYRNWRQGA